LLPVAESRSVHLQHAVDGELPVSMDASLLSEILFRLMDSVLNLTRPQGNLRAEAVRQSEDAVVVFTWDEGHPPEHSPFSRPELGLMIALSRWEHAGAQWARTQADGSEILTVRMPTAWTAWPGTAQENLP